MCFHVLMAHEFASVGLFDAATDASAKMHVLFEQPQSRILYQLFGVGTTIAGDSRELRFLLGSEVYFHRSESRHYRSVCQYRKDLAFGIPVLDRPRHGCIFIVDTYAE